MEFYLLRYFYLQDLAGGNQHLIKFLMAGTSHIILPTIC